MSDPEDDLADLVARLREPKPPAATGHAAARVPKPIYLLTVDDPDPMSVVLIVRTGEDGVVRGKIVLPRWQELAAGWDGPHDMRIAVPLADDYAHEYGYRAIAIDIESSQMWDPAWGELDTRWSDL